MKTKGFTIIEVLIVLAIAGLILLIVFLSVPALQRNQRNESRNTDIVRIGGVLQEYKTSNNNSVPRTATDLTKFIALLGQLSYYTTANISISTTAVPQVSDTNVVIIGSGLVCGSLNEGVLAASNKVALLYALESGATGQSACKQIF